MHLLDTDTLSRLHSGNSRVAEHLNATSDEVGTTIVTKIEILRARFAFLLKASTGEQLLRAQHWLRVSEQLLAALRIVDFGAAEAHQFDRLRSQRKLRRIGHADVLIASIALANDAVLVTRNLRHFRQIPNLALANWVDS